MTENRQPIGTDETSALQKDTQIADVVGSQRSLPGEDQSAASEEHAPFARLIIQAKTYLPDEDISQLYHAFDFATAAHKGQLRKSGEAFVNHPAEVAIILSELRMDVDTLAAALLHDTVEDSDVTLEEIEAEFSPDIAELVDGVTKITRLEIESLSDEQANNFRKMLLAMSKDIRIIVIKLADRLHNMRTLTALREDRRIFKARETMEIYAPLAHRLGIGSIKWELEDLSFFYLEPQKMQQVSRMVAESRDAREAYLAETIQAVSAELDKVGIRAKINGRPKHLYSIYQKMTRKGKGFSEIYDLIALRVIVESVKDCYSTLGAVHTLWHPMPGRFKDYIAMPKANGYQSLHTTVIGPAGRPLEIQIRTKEMHRMSEYGVAAHWRYKDGTTQDDFDEKLSWLRSMLDWQDETTDSKEFMEGLKVDLFENEVFVFTPKGDVISLRAGSTPLDFAYAIHTEVGHHCVGAKINGSIVPLSYELQMGDRIEILTQKTSTPSRDWLNIVKTTSARAKIRAYFTKANKGDDVIQGRDILGREMRKHGLGISSTRSVAALKKIAAIDNYQTTEDLMAAIGAGKLSPKQVANQLLKVLQKTAEEKQMVATTTDALIDLANSGIAVTGIRAKTAREIIRAQQQRKSSSGIMVKGVEDVLIHLSKCCNPVPGDDIIGFVTRGRGVTVHRRDCPNAKELIATPERLIDVEWEQGGTASFQVDVLIEGIDRPRLFQDVAIVLGDTGAHILTSSSRAHSDGIVEMHYLFQVGETEHIEKILSALRGVDGIFTARRVLPGDHIRK
jgi:GTP diphosphokinase / guanosine-3',5'-bis(diphosphate) 3'-diphosphatase